MMSSMTPATDSFHLPQHAQLMPDHRILLDSAHSCAPPPPQNKSYFNPQTNETLYFETEVKVHEIGILFDYQIYHSKGVTWEDDKDEESGGIKGLAGKAGDFFGGLFGGGKDEDDAAEAEGEGASAENGDVNAGASALLELEQKMASEMWLAFLQLDSMSWNADNECTGLVIQGDTMRQRGDVLDGAEGDDNFSGTKLLGLTYMPPDNVNPNGPLGCTGANTGCTSILGQVAVAYSGADEYSVIQMVTKKLEDVMLAGSLIPNGSPALNVEFQSSGGTAPVGGNGQVIPLNTARGTEGPEEEEDDYLSKYGVLFVCLVAVLGAGFVAAMVVRYKKRQKRMKEMDEGFELSEEEYQANLALHAEDEAGKTEGESSSMADSPSPVGFRRTESPTPGGSSRADSPPDGEIIDQVELEVPPADSGVDSNEVEISLSGSKSYGY